MDQFGKCLIQSLWQSSATVDMVLVFGGRFADNDGANVGKI